MTRPRPRIITLQPFEPAQMPTHPALSDSQRSMSDPNGMPDLRLFLTQMLDEAYDVAQARLRDIHESDKVKKTKDSSPSNANVQVWQTNSTDSRIGDREAWFARYSKHEDTERPGTASMQEFEQGILIEHSENEADYTPNVLDARQLLSYHQQINSLDGGDTLISSVHDGIRYTDVTLKIYEMLHQISGPFDNRVFATVIASAKILGTEMMLLAQVPINLSEVIGAFYSNGRHRDQGDTPEQREKLVVGQYTSVEAVKRSAIEGHLIEWLMATCSDAKGSLPLWMQRLPMKSVVAKDVGFFIGWTERRRHQP